MPNIPLQNRNFGFLKTNRILDGQKLRDHKGLPNRLLASLRKATRGGGKKTPRRKTIKANTKGENVINPYLSIMGARVAPSNGKAIGASPSRSRCALGNSFFSP